MAYELNIDASVKRKSTYDCRKCFFVLWTRQGLNL